MFEAQQEGYVRMRSSFRQEFSSKHNLMNAMSCDPYQVNYYAVVHCKHFVVLAGTTPAFGKSLARACYNNVITYMQG